MTMDTLQSISQIIDLSICESGVTYKAFKERLAEGLPTRDENPRSHFCVYFLPYDTKSKKVFMAHHKKSGLWLSPGGHIDQGEDLLRAVNREIDEELGVKGFFKNMPSPFLLTVTRIENQVQPCKAHYDIWFLVSTDGSNFNVDATEFHTAKWLAVNEAREIVADAANLKALELINNET